MNTPTTGSELLCHKTVLITGGTKGLGKATAIAFAKAGARVFVTHKWGSVDEAEFNKAFQGCTPATMLQADVGDEDDALEVMRTIKQDLGKLDIFISNVAFSKVVNDIGGLKASSLELSFQYSVYPLLTWTKAAYEVFSSYPRYVLGISSDGGIVCHPGYDAAGCSKGLLETLCRYLSARLREHNTLVNVVRPGYMDTDSSRATFGADMIDALGAQIPDLFIGTEDVASVCLALCSGLMDGVNGQVITVDHGVSNMSVISQLKTLHQATKASPG